MPEQFYRVETYRARRSIGYLMRRAYGGLASRVEEAFAGADVTLTQWIILINLRDGTVQTAADICHDLRHDSGALTRVLDQLEQRGLIERKRSVADRRMVELRLTDAGRETVDRLLPRVVEYQNSLFRDFSAEEVETLVRLLSRFVEQFNAPQDGAAERRKEPVTT